MKSSGARTLVLVEPVCGEGDIGCEPPSNAICRLLLLPGNSVISTPNLLRSVGVKSVVEIDPQIVQPKKQGFYNLSPEAACHQEHDNNADAMQKAVAKL